MLSFFLWLLDIPIPGTETTQMNALSLCSARTQHSVGVPLYGCYPEREVKIRMAIELIPQGDGDSGLSQLQSNWGVRTRKRLCNVLFYVNTLYLLRMIPNLMLRFDFKCLEHRSTEKPKSCNGSAEKNTTDEVWVHCVLCKLPLKIHTNAIIVVYMNH